MECAFCGRCKTHRQTDIRMEPNDLKMLHLYENLDVCCVSTDGTYSLTCVCVHVKGAIVKLCNSFSLRKVHQQRKRNTVKYVDNMKVNICRHLHRHCFLVT